MSDRLGLIKRRMGQLLDHVILDIVANQRNRLAENGDLLFNGETSPTMHVDNWQIERLATAGLISLSEARTQLHYSSQPYITPAHYVVTARGRQELAARKRAGMRTNKR